MTDPNSYAADGLIFNLLSSDSTLTSMDCGDRIYDVIPQTAVYPLIQIRFYFAIDIKTANDAIVMTEPNYIVTAIDRATTAGALVSVERLIPIAARIHVLLHDASGNNALGQVLHIAREREHRSEYQSGGIEYRELGGLYKSMVGAP